MPVTRKKRIFKSTKGATATKETTAPTDEDVATEEGAVDMSGDGEMLTGDEDLSAEDGTSTTEVSAADADVTVETEVTEPAGDDDVIEMMEGTTEEDETVDEAVSLEIEVEVKDKPVKPVTPVKSVSSVKPVTPAKPAAQVTETKTVTPVKTTPEEKPSVAVTIVTDNVKKVTDETLPRDSEQKETVEDNKPDPSGEKAEVVEDKTTPTTDVPVDSTVKDNVTPAGEEKVKDTTDQGTAEKAEETVQAADVEKVDEKKVKVEEDTATTSAKPTNPVTPVKEADTVSGREKPNYPPSLAKLRQLTVNIGPIRQRDLMSRELHGILSLNNEFEVKFELKSKQSDEGVMRKEKLGFVRIPFVIKTPGFLITVAQRLGNLHIDGRDMSVKFPEAFNSALDDCKKYVTKTKADEEAKRKEMIDLKKRQVILKNIPPTTDEDTIKSLFPEASKVFMNMVDTPDGKKKLVSVILEFESLAACREFEDTNKDVQIEDKKVKIFRVMNEDRPMSTMRGGLRGRGAGFRGRGIGSRGRGMTTSGYSARVFGKSPRGLPAGRGGRGAFRGVNPAVKSTNAIKSTNMGPPPSTNRGGNRPGNEGQFKNFKTSPNTGGRGRGSGRGGSARPGQDQGQFGSMSRNVKQASNNQPFQHDRKPPRSPDMRGSQTSRSQTYRNDRQSRGRGQQQSPNRGPPQSNFSPNRSPQQSRDRGTEEDPMAMMAYLKSTLARMEDKLSQKSSDSSGRRDSYHGDEGGFRNDGNKRKRKMSDHTDSGFNNKKQYQQSGGYSGGSKQRDYSSDQRQPSPYSVGSQASGSYSNQGYGNQSTGSSYGNQSGSYGNQSGSYGNTSGSYGNTSGSYGNTGGNYSNSGMSGAYGDSSDSYQRNTSSNYGNTGSSNSNYDSGRFTGQKYN